jgi:hypothetical protein
MTIGESDLDNLYGEFCRALSDVGEAQAPLLLARFALLAIAEIDDVERVQRILTSARNCEAAATNEADNTRQTDSQPHTINSTELTPSSQRGGR